MNMRTDARARTPKTPAGSAARTGPYAHSGDNGKTIITAGDRPDRPAGMVTSTDPYDRAHLQFDGGGLLRPAAHDMDGLCDEPIVDTSFASKPRRYPVSCCVGVAGGHGVPHDSMFDAWFAAARRLSAAGIEVGLGTAAGSTDDGRAADMLRLADVLGREKLRTLLRPRLRTAVRGEKDREQAALSAEADRLIRAAAGPLRGGPPGGAQRKSSESARIVRAGKAPKTTRRGRDREVAGDG